MPAQSKAAARKQMHVHKEEEYLAARILTTQVNELRSHEDWAPT